MSIDIAKKNRSRGGIVNLRKIVVNGLKKPKPSRSTGDDNADGFSRLPVLAAQRKIQLVWLVSIGLTSLIVISWFYLVSQGVILKTVPISKQDDSLAKFSTAATEKFAQLKDQFSKKDSVLAEFKQQLAQAAVQQQVINNLKNNLEQQLNQNSTTALTITSPVIDSYIGNPVKIIGKGQLTNSQFTIRLKDLNNNLLGQSTGLTIDDQVLASFAVDLSYNKPLTNRGQLELLSVGETDKPERTLFTVPVKFIPDLANWQLYQNDEFSFSFNYPSKWSSLLMTADNGQSFLQFNDNDKLLAKENLVQVADDSVIVNYYRDINQLEKKYPAVSAVNLETFLSSNSIPIKEQQAVYFNGYKFDFILSNEDEPIAYYFIQNEAGEIIVFSFLTRENNSLDQLQQILSTFKFLKPDLNNWQTYETPDQTLAFKYPSQLTISKESEQLVFGDSDPNNFHFFLFTMEPQIDNLNKWLKNSVLNSQEKLISSETKIFGESLDGLYFKTEPTDNQDQVTATSLGYLFNHNEVTYLFKTNQPEFANTFKNVLASLKLTEPVVSAEQ